MTTRSKSHSPRRLAPVVGLFFLAPLTAEYLAGYDTSTGNIGELFAGLHFLAPLYGGALVIREVARRSGRAWIGFPMAPLDESPGSVDLIGNAVFATVAIALLATAIRRLRKTKGSA